MTGTASTLASPLAFALAMALGGVFVAFLKSAPSRIWDWCIGQLFFTVVVYGDDEAYEWIKAWIGRRRDARRARRLNAYTRKGPPRMNGEDRRQATAIRFAPAPGQHVLRVGGVKVFYRRTQKQASADKGGKGDEILDLSVWRWNRPTLERLLQKIRDSAVPSDDVVEVLRCPQRCWVVQSRQPRRDPATLFLPDGLWEDVLADARQFLESGEWYESMGIPHRRGYLLYGPPGTGKSSLVKVLAGALGLDVAVPCLNRPEIDDDAFAMLTSQLQGMRSILLLEDVDAHFDKRQRTDDMRRGGVSFAGLLNALDGVAAPQGVIVVMTTNHPEKLDPALVRAGRVDRRFELGFLSLPQALRIARAICGDRREFLARFAEEFRSESLAPAELQGILMIHRKSPERLFDDAEAVRILRGAGVQSDWADPGRRRAASRQRDLQPLTAAG